VYLVETECLEAVPTFDQRGVGVFWAVSSAAAGVITSGGPVALSMGSERLLTTISLSAVLMRDIVLCRILVLG
jgi:hypothetical protein